jgi:phenylacetate-coenzyme A ligase PaaK-like adenylate-forming protein
VRIEFEPRRTADVEALRRGVAERFREKHGVAAELDLVPRGELPRFAYKAARVVDEA